MMQNNPIKPLLIWPSIKAAWHLMKGQKRYLWLMCVPLILFLVLVVVTTTVSVMLLHSGPGFTGLMRAGEKLLPLVLLGILALCFTVSGSLIAACNIAKQQAFDWIWCRQAVKRMGSVFCALLVMALVVSLLAFLPSGHVLSFLMIPVYMTYILLVVHHRGIFQSIIPAFRCLKGNYWRVLAVLVLGSILYVLLSMTIIGLIWSVPFRCLLAGVIYRDVIEPQLLP
jgi:hypothetical protein